MIKKNQLRLGDIIRVRLGFKYIVCSCPEGIRLLGNSGWMPFDEYDEELKYRSELNPEKEKEWDIIRVWRPEEQFRKVFSSTNTRLDHFYDTLNIISKSVEITNGISFDENNNFINISLYV